MESHSYSLFSVNRGTYLSHCTFSLKRVDEGFDTDMVTNRRIHKYSIGIAAVALIAASCAGSSAPSDVIVEAQWQCDVQRQAFGDLAALQTELDVRLTAAGLTRAEYDDFKQRLASSSNLREQVSNEYEAYCLS